MLVLMCVVLTDAGADVSGSESWRFFQDDVSVERIREAVSCQCADEALTVTVDTHMLQVTHTHTSIQSVASLDVEILPKCFSLFCY